MGVMCCRILDRLFPLSNNSLELQMNADTITAVIVDDHKDIVDVISEFIKIYQPKVKIVGTGSDGKEAVQLFEKHSPDVMLLDISMPVYDGLYAIENIRKINPSARIAVTSNSISDEIRYKLEAESIPIFDKTNELSKLLEYLEKLTVAISQISK